MSKSKVEELQGKIEAESAAISRAEQRKSELAGQRTQALEDGDDSRVDKIDAEIAGAETAITRARERIGVFEKRIEEARDAEVQSELDALESELNGLRVEGEKNIAHYDKLAKQIAAVLQREAVCDARIESGNRVLVAAGRQPVLSPNSVRCRAMLRTTKVVRRRVGLGEPEHPMHNVAVRDPFTGVARHPTTHEEIPTFTELDVETPHVVAGHFPPPLHKSVVLPRVDPDGADFWPNNSKPEQVEQSEQSSSLLGRVRALIGRKAA